MRRSPLLALARSRRSRRLRRRSPPPQLSASGSRTDRRPFLGDGRAPDDGEPERRRLPRRRARRASGSRRPAPSRSRSIQTDTLGGERAATGRPAASGRTSRPGRTSSSGAARETPRRARTCSSSRSRPVPAAPRLRRSARPARRRDAPVVRVQGIEAGVPAAELRAGRAGGARDRDRREDAHVPGVRVRRRRVPVGARPAHERAGDDRRRARRLARAPRTRRRRSRSCRAGDWPSGLYFLRITAADGRVGYAPFIVRPRAARQASRRRRARDADVAGLQLHRRERRRLGRLVVRQRPAARSST